MSEGSSERPEIYRTMLCSCRGSRSSCGDTCGMFWYVALERLPRASVVSLGEEGGEGAGPAGRRGQLGPYCCSGTGVVGGVGRRSWVLTLLWFGAVYRWGT